MTTSVLPLLPSSDWLNFRLANRRCFTFVHGGEVGAHAEQCDGEETEALWRLALVRDYHFDEEQEGGDESWMYMSIRCPPYPSSNFDASDPNPFLSTADVFIVSNAFVSWKHWRKIDRRIHSSRGPRYDVHRSAQVVAPYFLRAASLWSKIEHWCRDESLSGTLGPIIQASLIPGVPIDPVRHTLQGTVDIYPGGKFSAFKAVFAFYCGQRWNHHIGSFQGLFGGYEAYDHFSHTRWCPVGRDGLKNFLNPLWLIRLAQDSNGLKTFNFDIESGSVDLVLGSRHERQTALAATFNDDNKGDDMILRWFEEHANQLQRYSVGVMKNVGESILRFPNLNDRTNCSRSVTRGVEIVASSIHAIEMNFMFVYSIRMRLLGPEDGDDYMTPEQRGFETCQLVSRFWRITQGTQVNEVRGEGVIGYYPLLKEGEHENFYSEDGGHTLQSRGTERGYFVYQSCTDGREEGTMEGSLKFKVGNIFGSGEEFDVRVAPFPLKYPEFYY